MLARFATIVLFTKNSIAIVGSCASATIDPRHNKPQYNSPENCSQLLHFICEAKQIDLYKEKEKEENEVLPTGYKRHKYSLRISEMSNLALDEQKRSHPTDGDESTAHDQSKSLRDTDDKAHARHKRTLGEDYNGNDRQVLVDDTATFATNIDSHLNNILNSKLTHVPGINVTKEEKEILPQKA